MPCIRGKIYLFRTNDSSGSVTPAANKLGRKSRKKRKERKSRTFRQESSILVTLFGTEREEKVIAALHYDRGPWWQRPWKGTVWKTVRWEEISYLLFHKLLLAGNYTVSPCTEGELATHEEKQQLSSRKWVMQNGRMLLVFQQEVCPCFHHFPWVIHCFLLRGKKKEHSVSASEATFPRWEMYLSFSIFPTTNSLLSDSGKTKPVQRIPEGQDHLLSVNVMHTTAKVSPYTTTHAPNKCIQHRKQRLSVWISWGKKEQDLIVLLCCDTMMLHAARSFS